MPLVVTVSLIVLGTLVVIGVAAYLIEKNLNRYERTYERTEDRV